MGRMARNDWYALRFEILERDDFTCQYCGQHAPNVMLEVDHVIPVCEGGSDDRENLATACTACNRGKEGLRARRQAAGSRRPIGPGCETIGSQILSELDISGPTFNAQLAVSLGIDKDSIDTIMKRLVKRGLVVTMPDGRRARAL